MGRKKGDKPGQAPRVTAVSVKSTPEWQAWAEGFADFLRDMLVGTIDKALVEYAKQKGYEPPPPPR